MYSGDTRPCPRLAALGAGATILIHEATFDDNKQSEAVQKRHSTISEALAAAADMRAYRVILTHFSQRYPAMPPCPVSGWQNAILAFDFMKLSFSDLLWAPALTPAFYAGNVRTASFSSLPLPLFLSLSSKT